MGKTTVNKVISIAKIPIAAIPFAGGVINEVISFVQDNMLVKRLEVVEDVIRDQIKLHGISFEEFIDTSKEFSEHDYYVVRNTFKHLLLSAQPDTVKVLCKAMVDYSLKIEQDINQIVCEVISNLNSFDIKLLANIKKYIKSDEHVMEVESREKDDINGHSIINWKISKDSKDEIKTLEIYSIIKFVKLQIIESEYMDYAEVLVDKGLISMYFNSIGEKILNYI